MRAHRRHLWLVACSAVALAMLPSVASSVEPTPTIEAVNVPAGTYSEEKHYWQPSQRTVIAGGIVTFRNPYIGFPYHGLKFTSGPATPSCTGIPAAASEPTGASNWHGECTFSTPGTYTFICTVHPVEMKGTITVTNGEPTVTTEAATSVTEREATLKGTVNPNGKATEYFFKWGTTASYGQETSMQSAGAGTTGVAVSAMLKGLTPPGTLYHFRLVAKNERGTTEGADETFTTVSPPPPPGPPTATTGKATSLSETGATLEGMVNPDGEATKYVFQYGATTGYGQRSTEVTLPATDHIAHLVSAHLTGLQPGTTYHFRLVATNAKGAAEGSDGTFATTSPPPPPPPPTTTTPPPTTTTPLAEPPPGPPLVEGSLKLTAPRHGSSLRGSIEVSQSGAGGRLEVDLLAKTASLARRGHRTRQVTVGRLVRASVSAGKASFSVALNARAKSALRRHHKLAVTVKITLTPPMGKAVQITRNVVLRA